MISPDSCNSQMNVRAGDVVHETSLAADRFPANIVHTNMMRERRDRQIFICMRRQRRQIAIDRIDFDEGTQSYTFFRSCAASVRF